MSTLPPDIQEQIDNEAKHCSYYKGYGDEGYRGYLDGARLQIEYLHKKFGETGTGNNVLARIETKLAPYKEKEGDNE